MAIKKVTEYTGNVADPYGSQTQSEFTQNAFDQFGYLKDFSPDLNSTIDEINTAIDGVDQSEANAAGSAAAAEAAAGSAGYQGLWPDTGGSAVKGDVWQTQVSGNPTGEYFIALQNTTVNPVADDVNWRVSANVSTSNLTNYTDMVYKGDGVTSAVDNMLSGNPITASIGDICSTGGTTWRFEGLDPAVLSNYTAINTIHLVDFGLINDGQTDQTNEIIAAMVRLGSDYRGLAIVGINVVFNMEQLIPNIPPGLVLDISGSISGNNTSTFFEKSTGFLSSDLTENDTIDWTVSGHNAARGFNNFRTSPSTSADLGRATEVWALGKIKGGQARNIGLSQWAKSPAGDWWSYSIRAEAPWESVSDKNDMFEQWVQGEPITAGQYRKSSHMYKAVTSGTTGPNEPVHNSGVVSDGGVDWEYIANGDATTYDLDQYGRMGLNGRASDTAWQNNTMSPDDPSTSMDLYYKATGQSKQIVFRFQPTDVNGSRVSVPFFAYDGDTKSVSLVRASGGFIFEADDDLFTFRQSFLCRNKIRKESVSSADGDASPDVSQVNTLLLSNTSPTTITTLDNGEEDQEIQLIATNGNTTIAHGSGIRLQGSTNVTLTAFSVVTLRRIDTGITSQWIEVSRSIK